MSKVKVELACMNGRMIFPFTKDKLFPEILRISGGKVKFKVQLVEFWPSFLTLIFLCHLIG